MQAASAGGVGGSAMEPPAIGDRRDGLRRDIETALRTRALRFPDALEQRFEWQMAPDRLRYFVLSCVSVGPLCLLFLLADRLIVPDVLDLAIRARAWVFMPLCLVGAWLLPQLRQPRWREWLVALIALVAALTHVWVQGASQTSLAPFYPAGLVVLLTYCNIVQRIRFKLALGLNLAVLAIYGIALSLQSPQAAVVTMPIVALLVSCVVVTMYANYVLEADERHNFLLRQREALTLEDLGNAHARLVQLAASDTLTGVANRRSLDERLPALWAQASAERTALSLLLIDVDHFKNYNDRYGHPAGDECLRRIARAVCTALRERHDFVARYGGEEFAVLVPGKGAAEALQVAERVRQAVAGLALEHALPQGPGIVTISVGVASARPAQACSAEALLAAADAALYQAKQQGRNRVGSAAS